jgi:hypothetical protein
LFLDSGCGLGDVTMTQYLAQHTTKF